MEAEAVGNGLVSNKTPQEVPDEEKSTKSESNSLLKEYFVEDTGSENVSYRIACFEVSYRLWVFVNYVLVTFVSLVLYLVDVASDIVVAVRHFEDNHPWWAGFTIGFVVLPFLAQTVRSICDVAGKSKCGIYGFLGMLIVVAIMPFATILALVKALVHGICAMMSTKERGARHIKFIRDMLVGFLADSAIMETFLESAPQLLLQLYILTSQAPEDQNLYTVIAQTVSITSSLISLASGSTETKQPEEEFHFIEDIKDESGPSSDRSGLIGKMEISLDTVFLLFGITEFLWHFCAIAARMIALAFFAAIFSNWVYLVIGIHYIVTVILILKHIGFRQTCMAYIRVLFVAMTYIFSFVRYFLTEKFPLAGESRIICEYMLYYGFTFSQNTPMVVLAYTMAPHRYPFHLPLLIAHFVGFTLGLVFLTICYLLQKPLQVTLVNDPRR